MWLWIAIEPIDKIVPWYTVAFILNIGDVIADRMSKSIDDINLIDRFPF